MVKCGVCRNSFHKKCVGITDPNVKSYTCAECKTKNNNHVLFSIIILYYYRKCKKKNGIYIYLFSQVHLKIMIQI